MGGSDSLSSSIGHNLQRGPIANPGEMAFTHELAIDMLASIPAYRAEFKKAFKTEPINIDQVTDAIAAFEETLVTPNSRFDKWLEGDEKALSKDELTGYQLFKTSGCVACHNGLAVTGNEVDRFNFKMPTLRNVELTYPYLHDGAANTLTEAVDIMGRLQLGRKFTDDENKKNRGLPENPAAFKRRDTPFKTF